MFDLSLAEMGVIVVTAALVIGPKDLPVVLRKGGRAWAKFKHFAADLRRQFDESPLGAELRKAEAEVAHEMQRTHTILGADGLPYEAYAMEGITDHSRAQGPTPIGPSRDISHSEAGAGLVASPLEGGRLEGGGATSSDVARGPTPSLTLPPLGGGEVLVEGAATKTPPERVE